MNEIEAQEEGKRKKKKRQEITSRLAPRSDLDSSRVIFRHSNAQRPENFHRGGKKRSISAMKINKYQFKLSGSSRIFFKNFYIASRWNVDKNIIGDLIR